MANNITKKLSAFVVGAGVFLGGENAAAQDLSHLSPRPAGDGNAGAKETYDHE